MAKIIVTEEDTIMEGTRVEVLALVSVLVENIKGELEPDIVEYLVQADRFATLIDSGMTQEEALEVVNARN